MHLFLLFIDKIIAGAVLLFLARQLRHRSEERRVGKECRSLCDWSSDVCSSDLSACSMPSLTDAPVSTFHRQNNRRRRLTFPGASASAQIGRASCRERV